MLSYRFSLFNSRSFPSSPYRFPHAIFKFSWDLYSVLHFIAVPLMHMIILLETSSGI